MHLIADSGSTKTHWCLIEGKVIIKELFTKGINPFYQEKHDIEQDLAANLLPGLSGYSINRISFYGAGCSFPEKKLIVFEALGRFFKNTVIEVESDLLGAARSLCGNSAGIACILGTGSNSCYYDGNEIIENVSPLGYILGDEGSGAVLSKKLVSDCLKKQLPAHIIEKFMAQYSLTPAIILENVYKKPFPNRYLAQFTPFLSENIHENSIMNIVSAGFREFFRRNLAQYPEGLSVGFIGSVAYHLQTVLNQVAAEENFVISKIEKSPVFGLTEYYQSN
jgi:N-acetylglucosamine kinase-like BadF-type ATPase